jgi:uncharacterized membrane protein HdeD (DUF308 family)
MEEGAQMDLDEQMLADEAGSWWWVFLVTGVLWLVIGIVVLRLNLTSVATVGYLLGAMFVLGALAELMVASSSSGGWKFLHYLMATIFVIGAIWSFVNPQDSFFALASVLGLVLLFMGTLEIVSAVASRGVNPTWGLGLAVGILEVLLAIWVSQQFYPARAALILLWVGFMAIFKGISNIVLAFGIRSMRKELRAAG